MRRLDVIALDEAFQQDLPVDLELALGGREQALLGRDQLVEPAQRIVAQRRLVLGDEHQAEALARRHRHQRMRLLVEAGKARLVRDMAQAAFQIVGPAVIAADEGARAARIARHLHAAMAAGVAEGAHLAVDAAHHDGRRARRVARDVGADLGQRRRRAERRRRAPQHALDLRGQPLLRLVVGDRLAPDLLADIGRAVGDMVEDALRHRPVIHCRFHPASHTPCPSRRAERDEETAPPWDESRSTVRSALLGELAAQPALEAAQGRIGRLLRAVHQPVAARGMAHREGAGRRCRGCSRSANSGASPSATPAPFSASCSADLEAVDPDRPASPWPRSLRPGAATSARRAGTTRHGSSAPARCPPAGAA